jgi:hypothetical protein
VADRSANGVAYPSTGDGRPPLKLPGVYLGK